MNVVGQSLKWGMVLFLLSGCASLSSASEQFVQCSQDEERQKARSAELARIVEEDQADRVPPIDWNEVAPRDEARAMRVAEIFAEGCFNGAADYAAAALIFQHGTVSDHYYQAYLWSKKTVELGREDQSQMVANAVDRYLMSKGQKQLFGAQTFRKGAERCVCLGDTEESFPDSLRVKYTNMSLRDRIDLVKSRNAEKPSCQKITYCSEQLAVPEKGQFPGIW